MQIIQDIAVWLSEQPAWLSDCARRLINQGNLTDEDRADLVALVKSHHGLTDPMGRQPVPIDLSAIPEHPQPGADIRLRALRELQHLNALDSSQCLTFQPEGITVVYGYNGTGKSGYARALKKACRARSVEAVYPNVYAFSATVGTPSATIDWLEAGEPKTGQWIDATEAPSALSQISVFDSNCARVFLDSQAQVLFVPGGLEVMHGLAAEMTEIHGRLVAEMQGDSLDLSPLSNLAGPHVVGREYERLSSRSTPQEFQALASLSEVERQTQTALRKLFNHQDPARQAEGIRRLLRRMSSVTQELLECSQQLQDVEIQQLRQAFAAFVAAEGASKLITDKLRADGALVAGTGSEPWEVLLRSAMTFVSTQAYPGHLFPGPDQGANCVLCQQPLTEEASTRLRSFVQYLENDAQHQLAQQRATTIRILRAIMALSPESLPTDTALLDEIEEDEPNLAASIEAYAVALAARKAKVVQMASSRTIGTLEPLPEPPFQAIESWVEQKTAVALALEQTMTQQERAEKLQQLADLDSRERLGPLLPLVLQAIEQYKRNGALMGAIRSCSTAALTRKTTELFDAHVTEGLRTAFTNELGVLGIPNQQILLEMIGQKGGRLQQLKLQTTPPFSKTRLSHILSEGEQRVVALAMFLAEIGVGPGNSGLIFDDPVSSLDHRRRDRIARRLVVEAKKRQVIVFTHDLAFALALTDYADDQGVSYAHRHLSANMNRKGLASEDLPFEAKKIKGRIEDLRALAARAKTALETSADFEGYNDLVRNGYRRMRDTWEQLVEDVLLQSTVRRYRVSVETTRLRSVSVEDGDASAVYNGMTRCSMFTHEGGTEAPPTLPEPAEFAADVEALAAYAKQLEERAKVTQERRKLAGLGA